MRIQVSRTGGFAGISRHHEVDTEGREDAAEWESRGGGGRAAAPPPRGGAAAPPRGGARGRGRA
ncbi:hypothetical protein ACFXPU_35450, partial [Streptomyces cyaneofuscatus]